MIEGVFDGQQFPFPHCNSEVLHAPGVCYYCDHYPSRQDARLASGTPFSTPEANGWSGNVAVKAGEVTTHLGATYVVGEPRSCRRFTKFGWYCRREPHTDGPCAAVPRWWNLREHLRYVGRVW